MNKPTLRRAYLHKRANLSPSLHREYSRAICRTAYRLLEARHAYIHTFLPIIQKNEIDTYPLINDCLKSGRKVVVSRADFTTREMTHYLYDPSFIQTNKYGIPEPSEGQTVSTDRIDVVIVPLLVADKNGHRVGYGGGFYDRFLSTCRDDTLKVGLSFFPPVSTPVSDVDLHDISLDALVSPDGYTFF